MLKIFLFSLLLTIGFFYADAQQKNELHIQCNFPKKLKSGNKINLPVKVLYKMDAEKTGNVTMELFNEKDKQSIDGWFINIFPFQYFTSIPKENFAATFPFTVPSNFTGKIKIVLKANCNNVSDSIASVITVFPN